MNFKRGQQVAYVPKSANGDLAHKDVEFGTIVRKMNKEKYWCRFYINHIPQNIELVKKEFLMAYEWR